MVWVERHPQEGLYPDFLPTLWNQSLEEQFQQKLLRKEQRKMKRMEKISEGGGNESHKGESNLISV